ncbi:MAG: hypothetical protein HC914_06800 [Chloroflexaceae bacterium]|nr:hypothetical protein [Chloroflexaceae bacterium]
MASRTRDAIRAACWTTLFLLGVYLLINGGQTFISDGEIMLQTTARLVDYHTLTLAEEAAAFPQVVRGQGGFLFSPYGVGQPLAAGALYAFGTYVLGMHLLPGALPYNVGRFCALLLPAIATALTGGMLAFWGARLYQSLRIGVVVALLYGLGTLALPYSRFFFSEPLFTCCLVLAGLAIALRSPWGMLLAGLVLGYAVATRIAGVFVLPAFVLYAWLVGQRLKGLVLLGVGLVPGAVLVLLNNWIRFRAIFERGYEGQGFTGNFFEGLAGLLFSPGKSVLLYVPLLLALPLAVWPFARRCKAEAVLIGGLTLVILIYSSLWWIWWGGWGVGAALPRPTDALPDITAWYPAGYTVALAGAGAVCAFANSQCAWHSG